MQVRKFEAKTIKDAIELVKFHMGPEAIILSAKDNGKNFGLMGESSVEVTAAVSESKLVQKRFAESKLNAQAKQKYQTAPAKIQKQFIEKALTPTATETSADGAKESSKSQGVPQRKSITTARYIDISDDSDQHIQVAPPQPVPQQRKTSVLEDEKIISLQNEILRLKSMLNQFQPMPQNFLSLHPGASDGLPYELSFAYKKLTDAGITSENVTHLLKMANDVLPLESKKKKAFVDGWVIKYLLDHLTVIEKQFKSKFQIFVGPTGQGKTSMVVKLAFEALMKGKKKIAILAGDFMKVGAADQLKTYCQILNVPCGAMSKWQDWAQMTKKLENFDLVFLDTPGVNLRTAQDLENLRSILPPNLNNSEVHYVQSAMARDTDAMEVAERFKVIGFNDVIFTRLDEAVQHGIIYNFQKNFGTPLHSFGIGNSVPDDFEFASKERVVDLIFNLSKIKKERGS